MRRHPPASKVAGRLMMFRYFLPRPTGRPQFDADHRSAHHFQGCGCGAGQFQFEIHAQFFASEQCDTFLLDVCKAFCRDRNHVTARLQIREAIPAPRAGLYRANAVRVLVGGHCFRAPTTPAPGSVTIPEMVPKATMEFQLQFGDVFVPFVRRIQASVAGHAFQVSYSGSGAPHPPWRSFRSFWLTTTWNCAA